MQYPYSLILNSPNLLALTNVSPKPSSKSLHSSINDACFSCRVSYIQYEQMKQDKKNKRGRIPNTKKLAGSMQIIILFVLHDELLCFEAHAVDLKIQLIIQVFFG